LERHAVTVLSRRLNTQEMSEARAFASQTFPEAARSLCLAEAARDDNQNRCAHFTGTRAGRISLGKLVVNFPSSVLPPSRHW
jgi:hypothetical protein